MTETEIIKLVFGLFLGVGGGVLLLLAFTVGYRYLVMEQRCTCRTNGTVTGYSAVSYGGEGSAVHLPVARYTVEGQEYRVTGPAIGVMSPAPSALPLRKTPAAATRKTASCTLSAAAILSSE